MFCDTGAGFSIAGLPPNDPQMIVRRQACIKHVPDPDPPPRSCPVTNWPVYGESGIKRQVEADYTSNSLTFERVWASDRHRFVWPGQRLVFAGTQSASNPTFCWMGQYDDGQSHPHCFPFVSIGFDYPKSAARVVMLLSESGDVTHHKESAGQLVPSPDINIESMKEPKATRFETISIGWNSFQLQDSSCVGLSWMAAG
jgi:hypothetical protein